MNYKLAFALGLIAPGTVGREQYPSNAICYGKGTTALNDAGTPYFDLGYFDHFAMKYGVQYALYVNGAKVLVAERKAMYVTVIYYIGNYGLVDNPNAEGEDYLLRTASNDSSESGLYTFFCRTPGTYSVYVVEEVSA